MALKLGAVFCYALCILGANWAIQRFGVLVGIKYGAIHFV